MPANPVIKSPTRHVVNPQIRHKNRDADSFIFAAQQRFAIENIRYHRANAPPIPGWDLPF
jgi:hypothetical protein